MRTPQVRAPRFASNLYRDMRDRRLLLPALALLVALFAVPVLMKHSSSSAPPPAVTPAPAKASAAEPAVVTQQLGVTNYKKRLERLKSKNPFRQQFTSVPKRQSLKTTSSGTPSSGLTTSSGTSSSGASTSTTSTSGASAGSGAAPSAPPVTTTTPAPPPPKPKLFLFSIERRIDVKVGPAGDLNEKKGVRQLSLLPNKAKPIVAYLGTNEAGDKALFLVSNDVTDSSGDGVCLAPQSNCQYMTLKVGDVETFDYGPDPSTTYKLRLVAINQIVRHRTVSPDSSQKLKSGDQLGG
jgi:hypothetical protein